MKNLIYSIIALIAAPVLLISCSMDENAVLEEKTEQIKTKILQAHIEQEYISADMMETVSREKYPQFYTPLVAANLETSAISKESDGEQFDAPLIETDMIPIWRHNKTTVKIYDNGEIEIEKDFPLYEKFMGNTLMKIAENAVDEDLIVTRTKYTGGILSMYNSKGSLINSIPVPMPDFSGLLDSASNQAQFYQEYLSGGTKSCSASGIELLKEQIDLYDNTFDVVSLEETNNGDIILIQESSQGNGRVKTRLSGDLTKTYEYCIYQGEQLMSHSISYYTENSENFSNRLGSSGIMIDLPVKTVMMSLVYKNNIPMVHSEYNYFIKNKSYINTDDYENL
jgi:hypothetical protein